MVNTSYDFYSQIFGGKADRDTIVPLLASADRLMDGAVIKDISDEISEEAMMTAACIHAEYSAKHGSGGYSSVKLGDFSISGRSSDAYHEGICSEAYAVLERAGLLYRGGVSL